MSGQNRELTKPRGRNRADRTANGQNRERTEPRMDKTANGQNREQTEPRMDKIANGQNRERTKSRTDKTAKGQNRECTKNQTSKKDCLKFVETYFFYLYFGRGGGPPGVIAKGKHSLCDVVLKVQRFTQ